MKAKLLKLWRAIEKEKHTRLEHIDDSVFFKRISVSKHENDIEAYDTSTNIYRPLKTQEIDLALKIGVKNFVRVLQVMNLSQRLRTERENYQRESIKGNEKKRDYYFGKAKETLERLREVYN